MRAPRGTATQATDEVTRVHDLVQALTGRAGRLEAAAPIPEPPKSLAFERIVVGADGSASADQAAAWAAGVARVFGARTVAAVTAIPAPGVVDHYLDFLGRVLAPGAAPPDDLEAEADAWGRGVLARAGARVESQGIGADQVLRHGPAVREVADVAAERGADLVVVGRHGHRGAERALLGSVADGVKQHVRASVLIAKDDPPPRRILAATDGSRASQRAVGIALRLGRSWGAPVTVLYVLEPLLYGPDEEVAARLDRALAGLDLAWTEPRATADVAFGPAAPRILEAAERLGAGLVVLGSRGLGGIRSLTAGSVSNRVSHESPCSVLLVKEVAA